MTESKSDIFYEYKKCPKTSGIFCYLVLWILQNKPICFVGSIVSEIPFVIVEVNTFANYGLAEG
jgi:hypothetical protein